MRQRIERWEIEESVRGERGEKEEEFEEREGVVKSNKS